MAGLYRQSNVSSRANRSIFPATGDALSGPHHRSFRHAAERRLRQNEVHAAAVIKATHAIDPHLERQVPEESMSSPNGQFRVVVYRYPQRLSVMPRQGSRDGVYSRSR